MRIPILILCVTLSWPVQARNAQDMLRQLDKKLRVKDQNAVVSALFIRDNRPILSLNPDKAVKLASVTKVLTAVSALEHLGANHRFHTKVFFSKKARKIYIQGGWDPLLNDKDMSDLADCVAKKAGKGPFRVFFVKKDQKRLPYCGPKDKNDHVYAAEPASLMVNLSAVKLFVGPVRNKKMSVTIQPDAGDYFKIDSHVRVTRRGRHPAVAVKSIRGEKQTIIRVRGRFPIKARAAGTLKRVFHPMLFAAWVFQRSLNAVGIKTAGKPVVSSRAKGRMICEHRSGPLSETLIPILRKSLNPGAQAIANAIFPADQAQALRIIEKTLKKAGVSGDDVRVNNGSGLGCGGIATTRAVVKVLKWSVTRPWADAFWHALPRPGKGTLKHRFLGGPAKIMAKTGTLDDCTALAGAFDDANGRRVFFAVVVNARGMNRPSVVHRINKAVEALGK